MKIFATRRQTLTGLTLGVLLAAAPAVASAGELGDDGLYKEPWMSTTFKDVRDDIAEAAANGKRLVLFVEQRGCIYCKKMHEEVYSDPDVAKYISDNFMVVQYNMFGDEDVTDLDGETMPEKDMARRWRVLFTPTAVFLPETAPEDGTAIDAAVSVMPGAFSKNTALHMFQWVRDRGYETDEPFQKYHARRLEEARAGKTD